MLNRLFIFLLILAFSTLSPKTTELNAKNIFGYESNVTIYGAIGVSYNFPASNIQLIQYKEYYSFNTPLSFGINIQFIEWWSLYIETGFVYNLSGYKEIRDNNSLVFYNHNFKINLPISARFYPMVYRGEKYENFFLSIGLIAGFHPVNYFLVVRNNKDTITADGYNTDNEIFPAPSIYMPVNPGIKVVMGNAYKVSEKALIGLDVFSEFLFIPIKNGYLAKPVYKDITGKVPIEFSVSIGISITIGYRVF